MKIILKKSLSFTVITTLCLIVVSLFAANGCDKSTIPQIDIYENRDISACGVKDPLQNIEWLREFCKNLKNKQDFSSVFIHLYKLIDTDEHIFRISVPSPIEYAPNQYYSTLYFRDCCGDTIFTWETMSPPSGLYDEFMKDKAFTAELYHFVKQ